MDIDKEWRLDLPRLLKESTGFRPAMDVAKTDTRLISGSSTIQKPLRASAESANRYIDDDHPRERLHHYGFQRNTLSMLAWQTRQNAQTETIFTKKPLPHAQPLSETG